MRPSRHAGSVSRRSRRPLLLVAFSAITLLMLFLHAHLMTTKEIPSMAVPLYRQSAVRVDAATNAHHNGAAAGQTTTPASTQTTVDPLFPPPPPLANDPNANVYVSHSAKPRGSRRRPLTSFTRRPRSPFGNDRDDVESDERANRAAVEGTTGNAPPPTTTTTANVAVDFLTALDIFEDNLLMTDVGGNPDQPSHSFVDIDADVGRGVALPYDPLFEEDESKWRACDPRNVTFSADRDALCQAYLSNLHNMRFIKAMPSRLLQGRTIKMKIYYAHNNIQAIVKLPQRKFVYEAASEYFAFAIDRALQFSRVPTTAYTGIPLDYLRAATAYSPLLSQWFHRFVVLYTHTNERLTNCTYPAPPDAPLGSLEERCTDASVQVWMKDVHPALDTFLGLAYEYTESFANKYYVPGHALWEGTKKSRLRAVGELLDRFIFDFLIGNTDRGMNDHNNFVYGGCSAKTECTVQPAAERVMSLAKYAYLDHGSSLYSHKEPEGNPFFGQADRIPICRFRRSTYHHLLPWRSRTYEHYPLFQHIETNAPPALFKVTEPSVLRRVQGRLDKLLRLVERCLDKYPESVVFSMPEYDQARIYEEDVTLDDLGMDFDVAQTDSDLGSFNAAPLSSSAQGSERDLSGGTDASEEEEEDSEEEDGASDESGADSYADESVDEGT